MFGMSFHIIAVQVKAGPNGVFFFIHWKLDMKEFLEEEKWDIYR